MFWKKTEPKPEPKPDPDYFALGYACESLHVNSERNGLICLHCGGDTRPAVAKAFWTYHFGMVLVPRQNGFVRWKSSEDSAT
jgi:hypothetical protein